MIYSKKFGRYFKNRRQLMLHEWRDRQTKPIFSWFGLRDAPYSEQYKKEKGLDKRPRTPGIVWLVLFLFLLYIIWKGIS